MTPAHPPVRFRRPSVVRRIAGALAAVAFVTLAGCAKGGDYSRGVFHGLVTDKTPAEVERAVGKPVAVEKTADGEAWVYEFKTFDNENMNKVDAKSVVVFAKAADGLPHVRSIDYTSAD